MHRTTVLISQPLRMQVDRYAQKHRLSLGQVIRLSLERTVAEEKSMEQDPFFTDQHFARVNHVVNWSENHDDALYADEDGEMLQ